MYLHMWNCKNWEKEMKWIKNWSLSVQICILRYNKRKKKFRAKLIILRVKNGLEIWFFAFFKVLPHLKNFFLNITWYIETRYIKYIFFRIASLNHQIENSIWSFETRISARKIDRKIFFKPTIDTPQYSVLTTQVWKKNDWKLEEIKISNGKVEKKKKNFDR